MMVMGDGGRGNKKQKKIAKAMLQVCHAQGCDFVLGLGDNIYPNGVSSVHDAQFKTKFDKIYKKFGRFDFWMLPGNHDWRGSIQAQIDYSKISPRWRMPAAHYTIPLLPDWLHLYALDTEKLSTSQLEAVGNSLRAKWGWKILAGHHPIVSRGLHGSHIDIALTLLPEITRYQVPLYLAGHDHHQEHIETPQFHQVVQGGAGANMRYVRNGKSKWKHMGIIQRFRRSAHGFSTVEMTREFLKLNFYDHKGNLIYQFEIHSDDFIDR